MSTAHCRRAPPVLASGTGGFYFQRRLVRCGALAGAAPLPLACLSVAPQPAAGTPDRGRRGRHGRGPGARAPRRLAHPRHDRAPLRHRRRPTPSSAGPPGATIPPPPPAVPNLGDGIAPNVEAVLASRPDLVILYNSAQNAESRRAPPPARHPGAPPQHRLPRRRRPGRRACSAGSPATRGPPTRSRRCSTPHSRRRPRPAPPRRPKVLLLVWEQPPMTIGRGSFLSELVERAGGRNLFADVSRQRGNGQHRGGRVPRSRPDPHHHRRARPRSPSGPSGRWCGRCASDASCRSAARSSTGRALGRPTAIRELAAPAPRARRCGEPRRMRGLLLLAVAVGLCLLAGLAAGTVPLSPAEVWARALAARTRARRSIVRDLRAPRVLLAFLRRREPRASAAPRFRR